MKRAFRIAVAVSLLAGLSSCATWLAVPVHPGQTEAQVVARLGRPTHVYPDGASRLLEYMHGPMGETTYMARIGPDGKLVSYKQVLTLQVFGTIRVGQSDKATVLRTVGAPSYKRFYSLSQLEVWSYPFKENDVWYSLMSIYFDKAGIVRKLENGPDPRYVYGALGHGGHK
jgi:outer membrane protein assembly factor BamE (lipoprotein component of BamABCDE complex)